MNQPLVSAILPVYNGERYLSSALDSIFEQDYRPLEVIVVDDGSTDASAQIAQSYAGIHYIYQANQGVPAARNAGLAAAQGEFIAFLDQDDLWTPHKLRTQTEHSLKNPELDYTIAKQKIFLEPGTEVPTWLKKGLLEAEQAGYLPGTLMVRKDALQKIGHFEINHETASDVEWFFRAKDLHIPMAIIPEVLLLRRIHQGNQSHQVKALHAEYIRIAWQSIQRQQGTTPREM